MTKGYKLDNSFIKVATGSCVIQVQEPKSSIQVYVGSDPNEYDAFIVNDVFSYNGTNDVYVKANKPTKIVVDDGE